MGNNTRKRTRSFEGAPDVHYNFFVWRAVCNKCNYTISEYSLERCQTELPELFTAEMKSKPIWEIEEFIQQNVEA